jgi:hypothetical protein
MKEDFDFDDVAPWFVALVTLAGGALRFLLLGARGMGLDEAMSVWLASHSVAGVLQWTAQIDVQPPLYYLLLHPWITVNGAAPHAARSLSVLLGTATIPVIYLIGKRMAGPMMGFAAAAMLAVSPLNVLSAQQTGMYTLLTFNAAVAIYALVRLLSDPRSTRPIGAQLREYWRAWRNPGPPPAPAERKEFSYRPDPRDLPGWRGRIARNPLLAPYRWLPIRAVATDLAWLTFIVFSAATLLTHSAAVLFPLAANVFVLGLILYRKMRGSASTTAFQPPSLLNWAIVQLAILALWSPWLPTFVRQASAVYRDFWLAPAGWDTVSETLGSLLNAFAPAPGAAAQPALLLIPFVFAAALGLVALRKKLSQFLFLACLFAAPIVAELVISLRRPVFYDRTLIWITIPLLLLLAAGVTQLRFKPVIFAALMILGSINLLSAGDYFRHGESESWSDAAGFVSLFAQPDDLVIFSAPRAQVAFDYYFQDFQERYGTELEEHGAPVDMIEGGGVAPRMTESDIPRLLSMLSGRRRVWLVRSRSRYADPQGIIPRVISANMELTRQRDFYGGQVQLYEVR